MDVNFEMLSGWRHRPRTRQSALYCPDKEIKAPDVTCPQVSEHVPRRLGFEPRLLLQGLVTLRSTGH